MDKDLLPYLPQVFRDDPATRHFLRAFSRLLLGGTDPLNDVLGSNPMGLEETLDALPNYFSTGVAPVQGKTSFTIDERIAAPDEFLPWLSQWVALSLRADITFPPDPRADNAVRRVLIADMAQLYRYRGTRSSLNRLLEIFTSSVTTDTDRHQVTLTPSVVIVDDQLDNAPHAFEVLIRLNDGFQGSDQAAAFDHLLELAHAVIRLEKPAHTRYGLTLVVTAMRVGQRLAPPPPPHGISVPTDYNIVVGKNTRLGLKPPVSSR